MIDRARKSHANTAANNSGPAWDRDPYPQWSSGVYDYLQCVDARRYRSPLFHRFTLQLEFVDMTGEEEGRICTFINLGDGGRLPGRNSRYYREWVMANGDHPRRGDRMAYQVFVGKIFKARVGFPQKRYDGGEHSEIMRYSLVEELLCRTGP